MAGDLSAAEQAIAMLRHIADSTNAAFYKIPARLLQGKFLIARGEFAQGVALLRSELDSVETPIWALMHPEFLGALAEGLAGLERLGEALATVDQALRKADAGGERYYVPELHRIKGELLLRAEASALAAAECFE
jgi:predicted ATPase